MSTSSAGEVLIRPLETWDEYLAAEELQRVVWQMPDFRDAVPANFLITAQKNSGIVLGAFAGDRLVGLAFSFLGLDQHLDQPTLKHHSHMLAVAPDFQSRKIGVRLKLAQRELALAQSIPLMTWTYDPLQAINANLNLVRLGAVARRYVPDAYGEMLDGLNTGIASDRFEAEWWLDTPRARMCVAGPVPHSTWEGLVASGIRPLLKVEFDGELPYVHGENEPVGDRVLVEIPAQIAAVKRAAPDQAREWRLRTRSAFTRAFAAGYIATDFVVQRQAATPRAAYVLTRGPFDTQGFDTFSPPRYNWR